MSLVNSTFGPPPLATPLTAQGPDEHGVPYENRAAQGGVPSGGMNPQWATWVSHLYEKPGDLRPSPSSGGVPLQYGAPLGNAGELLGDFLFEHVSVKMFGAKGDTRTITDAAMSHTSNPTHLGSASAAFTLADITKQVYVQGAGAAGVNLSATIIGIVGSTVAILSVGASTTVSAAVSTIGTDDTAAINAALAATPQGGTLYFPAGNYTVTSTIKLPGTYAIQIKGAGRLSNVIGCGFAIFWFTVAGQYMEHILVSDPVGDPATIGIYIYSGTPGNPITQVSFFDVVVVGNQSGSPAGVGIQLRDGVNIHFKVCTVAAFHDGLLLDNASAFNTTLRLDNCYLLNNTAYGWNTGTGVSNDLSASHCDFEGNGSAGIVCRGQNVVVMMSHFEANAINQVEIVSGDLFSFGNTYESGTILVDTNGEWVSFADQLAGVTLVNNSDGGATGLAGATIFAGLLGPLLQRTVTDGVMSSSVNPTHLSSATAAFTSNDVGKIISVAGAGPTGAALVGTVSSIISGTVAVLSASASTTVSGATVVIQAGTGWTQQFGRLGFTNTVGAGSVGSYSFTGIQSYLFDNIVGALALSLSGSTATAMLQVAQAGAGAAATFTGGAVGIGTAAPAFPLDIASAATGVIARLQATNAGGHPSIQCVSQSGDLATLGIVNGTFGSIPGSPLVLQSSGPMVLASPLNTPRFMVDTSGHIIAVGGLPTSAAGLPSGTFWNNGGVVNIAP